MKKILIPSLVAALLWFIMFNPWLPKPTDFWTMMTASGCILLTFPLLMERGWMNDIKISWAGLASGIGIAVALWCVFWVGDKMSALIFDFARPQVDLIYGLKDSQDEAIIAALLLCIIGPAEEIFWRGFVQRNLTQRYNANIGFVITTVIYTIVHIWAMNFMLLMSAMVCGIVWGLGYRLWPKQLFALVVSHAVWDAMVFVIFPI